ncbi:ATP-binding cassette domain-containing protein [Sporosarcina sp. G11-34]|uniref:ATP-binding cassette domain-containing protein n=1 Tax=Sporosarcina sp. G11-34 TaxID=2849605 RepID=UPI0022A9CEBF|nr:ATP-binding cassette domain-containing protein [Sporosarcina sp. G11-34]MCZ2259986.1 ATP-binding cassette domain-containing protein [Sporosarcina sp. G11-34]
MNTIVSENILLSTNKLVKTYKDYHAVNEVSMTINKGDIYGFIGQNGSGKTTFIRLLTQLIEKNSGSINYVAKEQIKIGAVIEGPVCYPYLSARDNLKYYAIQMNINDKNRISEVLEFVGLEDTGKKPFSNFSLGMKQRLGLALAILDNPDFLILDEPVNGLDPQGIVEIRKIIQRLNTEFGTTVLISSHILTELSMLATRYGIINEGRLVKELTKSELEQECEHYIILETSDDKRTIDILTGLGYDVKKNQDVLTLKEENSTMPKISKLLFDQAIYMLNFYHKEENLEDYYLDLIDRGVSDV